jgi:hypothetical protein
MRDSIHPKRLTRSARAGRLALAALVSAVLVAGCGGSSRSPTTSVLRSVSGAVTSARSSTATGDGATSSRSTDQGAGGSGPLAFAKCMRSNGVPNFPDPQPGGGALFSVAGINPLAPAVKAAQAKCQKLIGGGPPGPGSQTHPSAQTMAKLRRIAECMRAHGVPQFPDPRTLVPSNAFGSGAGVITDFDGAILLFPSTINLQAPAYKQALTACGAPPLGLRH